VAATDWALNARRVLEDAASGKFGRYRARAQPPALGLFAPEPLRQLRQIGIPVFGERSS
jgi:hypothetical protein